MTVETDMKKPTPPADLHPLTSAELAELYRKNPSPELRAALWEIKRLKEFISRRFSDVNQIDYLYFQNSRGALGEIKQVFYQEVKEAWQKPKAADAGLQWPGYQDRSEYENYRGKKSPDRHS
jgi:hypothetical protein